MAAEPEAPLHAEEPAGGWRVPLLVAAVLGLGVLGAILWLGRPGEEPPATPVPERLPALTPEAEAYLPQIEIRGVELSRLENFLGQQVTYLDFSVTNRGPRRIVALEATIEFLDPYEIVVLRETLRAVGGRRYPGPLEPGQSRRVRAAFEYIPADWNRRPPRLRLTGLLLE